MSYKVKLSPSGHEFSVGKDVTILHAAIDQNIGLPYGCRNGLCGRCVAQLLEGEVNYPDGRPERLAEEAEDACLPCKAVPGSNISLQVREAELAAEIKARLMPCRVAKVEHLAHDVVRLYLKLPEGQRLQFMAGQYLDFLLADGKRRAFSIANAPHDDDFIELHIRHVDGGVFTDWVFEQMQEKAILRIEAPLGSFTLDESSARPMLFIGGGTGFAPLKGQIEHAAHSGLNKAIKLYWGVRAQRDLYLPDLPQQWAENDPQFDYVPVLSEPDADWDGRSGWVHDAVLEDIADLAAYDVYMAGPPPMINAARKAFLERGLPAEQLFYDSFEYAENP